MRRKKTHLDDGQISHMRTLWKHGVKAEAIAAEFNCSRSTVQEHTRDLKRRRKIVSDERLLPLLDMGLPYADIARELGVSRRWVSELAARKGKQRRRRLSRGEIAHIRELWGQGVKQLAIVAETGRAHSVIYKHTRDMPRCRRKVEDAAYADLLAQGLRNADVARRLGVSKMAVTRAVRRIGREQHDALREAA